MSRRRCRREDYEAQSLSCGVSLRCRHTFLQKKVVGSLVRSDAQQELFVPMPVFARR